MVIKDLNSLKKFFRKVKKPIFGAGVYAFDRLGPEDFLPNYQILSLYSSEETNLIEKNLPVFCLEEKIKKKLRPKNSSTLLSHLETQKYLSRFFKPLILVYKSSKRIEKVAKNSHFKMAIPSYQFGKKLFEDKIKFRRILEKTKIHSTPGKISLFSSITPHSFLKLQKEFDLPFVLQHPRRGGGKGTFFVKDKEDFQRAIESIKEDPPKEIIVAKFINGPSPSITGCVTKFGILSTRPQYQICDIPILYSRPAGSGLFCGHDWSAADFSKSILLQAKEIVEKVGDYLKKSGYRGIFGIDFMEDRQKGKLYVTECNPRLLGSLPTLTMAELKKEIPPIIAFHILEYLEIPYDINIKRILKILWQKREGAQMILHNPLRKESLQKGEVRPGIYRIANNKLRFLRFGYKFSHLKRKGEFLLTEGLQKKGTKIEPYQRITRILTQEQVLDTTLKDITQKTKKIIKLVLNKFKIT
ncbi:MAG: hypothetical protein CO034_01415 [Parcubacteria group bacterium CG_4_9_14_0_2_um_filter_35_11]|nr:MAG: hypothetical protein COS98_00920 [Parcubacteria group bacterium CG07_land_8_20_14_0_80_35_11]PJC47761.1 MAG: hypothetical protein CO034_01415 [Parcubacteria group bacterium CG_4_9_14_0_2_um_filter_35_11]